MDSHDFGQETLADPMFRELVDVLWRLTTGELPRDRLRRAMDKLLGSGPILPSKGESTIVAPGREKTAALFFDRVWWSTAIIDEPPSVVMRGRTDFEDDLVLYTLASGFLASAKMPPENAAAVCDYFERHFYPNIDTTLGPKEAVVRPVGRALRAAFGISPALLYPSERNMEKQYKEGDRSVVVASVANLQVVDENSLSWDQVLEFREDADARRKLLAMMHWLDKEMVGKSPQFIEDEIALKLNAYEWAMKKHGIKTVTGTIAQAV